MTQAPNEPTPQWEGDRHALDQLGDNFTNRAGHLTPKPGYTPTDDDLSAIDYLFAEWDYTYAPSTEPEKVCNYPDCSCPFDAPADPNWCARGYPKLPNAELSGAPKVNT